MSGEGLVQLCIRQVRGEALPEGWEAEAWRALELRERHARTLEEDVFTMRRAIEFLESGSREAPEWLQEAIEKDEARRLEQENRKRLPKISPEWLQNDSFLNYAMSNKIPNKPGLQRRAVLLKNLGIGMARSGATDAELAPYVERVIANCPGRATADLWSWVRWAQSRPDARYNRAELIKWFRKNREVLHG